MEWETVFPVFGFFPQTKHFLLMTLIIYHIGNEISTGRSLGSLGSLGDLSLDQC